MLLSHFGTPVRRASSVRRNVGLCLDVGIKTDLNNSIVTSLSSLHCRDPGMKAMNSVGQKAINGQTLMKVLSVKPVLNRYVIILFGQGVFPRGGGTYI